MKEPRSLSYDELLELFSKRGMDISGVNNSIIQHINYYKLKDFATPFANYDDNEELCYKNLIFSDILKRYYQDKNLRYFMMHAIELIEVSIKANFSQILGERYGAFGYLDFNKWYNRRKMTRYTVERLQYRVKEELQKSLRRLEHKDNYHGNNFDEDGFPTVWIAIDCLTFGAVVKMLDILNEKSLLSISRIYGCNNSELLSWLKCIYFVRNICAHNDNLIDIHIKTKPKIRTSWYDIIYYHEFTGAKKATNRFAIILLIIMELVQKISPEYNWNYLYQTINEICIDDKRARLLGFQSKEKVESLL